MGLLSPVSDRILGTVLTRVDLSRLQFYDYYRSSAYIKPYGEASLKRELRFDGTAAAPARERKLCADRPLHGVRRRLRRRARSIRIDSSNGWRPG